MIKRIAIYLAVLLTFARCATMQESVKPQTRFSSIYNPSEVSLNLDFKVFHNAAEKSTLYIRAFPSELLFKQTNEQAEYRAAIQLEILVYEEGDNQSKNLSDSLVVNLVLKKDDMDKSSFYSSLVLQLQDGKKYLLHIKSRDMNRGSTGISTIFVDKSNVLGAQNFNVVTALNNVPKMRDYFIEGEVFRIFTRIHDLDTIYFDFLTTGSPYPRPPVTMNSPAVFPYQVDTTITVGYTPSRLYTLPGQGVFHLRADSSRPEGLTLNNFGQEFPQVKTERDLMEPLFYIATLAEYDRLLQSENTKLAVDEFWLKRNPSMERSRELIRIYYNRVLYSNIYFTSDREGWKTDRGMVYILFGPPDRMLDDGEGQIWYYVSRRRNKIIQFRFTRQPSIYTNDAFTWQKDIESMGYWNEAVRSWRNGKVFSLSN